MPYTPPAFVPPVVEPVEPVEPSTPVGSEPYLLEALALGEHVPAETAFTTYEVPVPGHRLLVWRFQVDASLAGAFDLEVLAEPDGDAYLVAENISRTYSMSVPWFFQSASEESPLLLRLRNRADLPVAFTLTTLSAEKFG